MTNYQLSEHPESFDPINWTRVLAWASAISGLLVALLSVN